VRFAPLFLLVPAAAAAQTAPEPQPDVVVLGTPLALPPGTPAYGSVVIDRERLLSDASGRVEDVLADVAGFQQFRRSDSRSANPSAQGVTLRALGGNATSRALVLLDGVPIADPFFGYIPFTALSAERLGAVRITRGGGSGAFGAGAVAGTVELVSAGRAQLPLASGSAAYGSFDSTQASVSLSPDLGGGYVTLFGRYERSDGFQTTPEDQRVAATARARFEAWNAGFRAVAPVGPETEVQATGLVLRDNRTLRFRGADSGSEANDASIRLLHRGAWQVDALAYVQARNFRNKVVSATSFRVTLDQRNTPSTGAGAKLEVRPPLGERHVLRVGADARVADGELYETAYNGTTGLPNALRNAGGTATTAGLFAEDDWTVGPAVLTGGVRLDRWTIRNGFFAERQPGGRLTTDQRYADRAGTEVTGRAGVLVHAARTLDLRAAGYTGFRVPTLNELYRPFVVFPITTQANAGLDPERLRGAEAGVDWRPAEGVALGLTAFANRLGDAVANVTVGPNLRQRRNVDAVVARGVEAELGLSRGPWSLNASYAFADSQVEADRPAAQLDGLSPAQSPRHTGSATLAWAPRGGPLASATVRHVGRQFEDDLETDVLPAATIVDAVGELPLDRGFWLSVRAENLLDEEVVTRNAGGSIDLGTPRTLWVGVRFGR
jgi:outer membrane receptor protein involved in Fe transport